MKHFFHQYISIVQDYFHDFRREFKPETLGCLAGFAGIGVVCGNSISSQGLQRNWIMGIPILFALFSGALHKVSLPLMMYLVPCSKDMREQYIKRMLKVKIVIPIAFGLLCDLAALFLKSLSCYVFVLQMTMIFFITCLCGMLNDGGLNTVEEKTAYGGMRYFVPVLLVFCYIGGMVLSIICMDSVSRTEFWVICSVMIVILLPMTIAVGRRWKQIRSNFASYETVAEME